MIDIDISRLNTIIEIPLDIDPNYTFDIMLEDESYQIEIRTFMSNDTRISIFNNNEAIAILAPVSIYGKNLAHYSNLENKVFFFLRNDKKREEPNFLNFNQTDLRLFYGSF